MNRFTVDVLGRWKRDAEVEAQAQVGRPRAEPQVAAVSNADKQLFERLLKILPYEGSIRFVDVTNMAGFSFDPGNLQDLERFHHSWVDAAHEFVDGALERKRRHLYSLIDSYLGQLALNTWPTAGGRQTVPPEWEHEQPERFNEVVERLHTLAGGIVQAHQDLVRTARRRIEL